MKIRRSWLCAVSVVMGLAITIDGSAPASAIQDGLPVAGISVAEQEAGGLVHLRWREPFNPANPLFVLPEHTCSGTLLANDWVLTAGHCAADMLRTPNGLSVRIASDPAQTAADAIYLFGGYSDEIGPDLALVHLQRRLRVNGSTTNVRRPFWSGSMAQLAEGSRAVSIYGQGANDRTTPPPGVDPCDDSLLVGGGTYRAGTAEVDVVGLEDPGHTTSTWRGRGDVRKVPGGRLYSLRPAAGNTQLGLPGDSGGPTFIFNPPDTTPYLLGIHSGGTCVNGNPHRTYHVGIPAVRDWIGAVLTSTWQSPTTSAYHSVIRNAEFDGLRRPVGNLDTVNWAQAARAAAAVCYNRGAVGGHLVGHQDNNTKIAHCSGGDTGWFDIGQDEINSTGEGFADISTVDWRQAARVAHNICSRRGFVGGQFNGHQREGRRGIYCYREGAQYIDATDNQMRATGWLSPVFYRIKWLPVVVPWAAGARAANDFCRSRKFVGGIMSGHYLDNKIGVVCQK